VLTMSVSKREIILWIHNGKITSNDKHTLTLWSDQLTPRYFPQGKENLSYKKTWS
jgi:hypothetical protein